MNALKLFDTYKGISCAYLGLYITCIWATGTWHALSTISLTPLHCVRKDENMNLKSNKALF